MAGRPTRANGRATAERLMEFGAKELERSGPVDFNLERVMRLSKVSRSSVYHHFSSREGLIVALEFEHRHRRVVEDIAVLRGMVLGAKDISQFFSVTERYLRGDAGPNGIRNRRRRIEGLVAGHTSKQLQKILADAQREGSDLFAEILEIVRSRFVPNSKMSVRGVSYFLQSLIIGRVLVDIVEDDVVTDEWVTVVMSSLRHLFDDK